MKNISDWKNNYQNAGKRIQKDNINHNNNSLKNKNKGHDERN